MKIRSFSFLILVVFLTAGFASGQALEVPQRGLIGKFETSDHRIQDVAFSPDGKFIAAGYGFYDDGGIRIWNIADRKVVAVLLEKESKKSGIKRIAFSRDGKYFVAAGDKGDVMLWHVGDWRIFKKIVSNRGDTEDLAFSPDSTKLAFTSEKEALLYEISNGKIETIALGNSKELFQFDGISFTPDGKSVVLSGTPGVQIWSTETRKVEKNWNNPAFNFFGRLSPDGKRFIHGGGAVYGEKLVRIRDYPDGKVSHELTGFRNGLFSLAISDSGEYFALGGGTYGGDNAGVFSLWSMDDAKELGFGALGDSPVHALAFSPDSKVLAVGSYEGIVLLYDVEKFRGRQIEKQEYALCGEISVENDKTYVVPTAKIPGWNRPGFGYYWKLEIANPEAVKNEAGTAVVVSDWAVESSSRDDQARVLNYKPLLTKGQKVSDYMVFGMIQNPGAQLSYTVKIYNDGSFAATNNWGQCLSYGNLAQFKTDYQTVKDRILAQNLLSIAKEPLTANAAHFSTNFIEINSGGVSEIRTDTRSEDVNAQGISTKSAAFMQIFGKEEAFIKSLLDAGLK